MEPSKPWIPETIYLVIKSLLEKGILPHNPESVIIERVGRDSIYPCGISYGPEGLDLGQLERAASEGKFWFLGPIKAVRLIIKTDSIEGDLQLEINKMIFTSSLNTLNYYNFETVANKLKKVSQELGLELIFKQINGSYNVNLTISYEMPISINNINEFIKKIILLHQSTDDL
jgi:hypothetical protein